MWTNRARAARAAAAASRVPSTLTATYRSQEARRCTMAAACTMARTPCAARCHTADPGLGHERQAGHPPDVAIDVGDRAPALGGGGGRLGIEQQAAHLAVDVAAEVQPRDRLLPGVAAFRVRHAADLVEAHFLGDGLLVHFGTQTRPAREDAAQLGCGRLRGRDAAAPSA